MLNSKANFDRQRVMQKKNNNKPWTAEDDGRLLTLREAHESHGAIGVALGRSTGSIIGRLSVLNTRTARLKRAATSSDQKHSLKGVLATTDPED
jgi:hypothetical protein